MSLASNDPSPPKEETEKKSEPSQTVCMYLPEPIPKNPTRTFRSWKMKGTHWTLMDHISNYCKVFVELNGYKTLPDKPNWHFRINDASLMICHHSVPCLGYKFDEKKKVRKPEYANITKKEDFIALRKQNVDVNMEVWEKKFVYVGDTSITVLHTNKDLFLYPIIIIECTFLHEEEKIQDKIEHDGHILWKDLKPFVLKHSDITWVLIHFSCRYDEHEIVEFFQNEQNELLKTQKIQNTTSTSIPLQNIVLWACHRTDGTKKF
ncbi:hypothetical protein RFI_09629 [Reticulomyxa filosa]|uniref:Uncharacterized protein n=1 Tax=Reticulomyxa filosa TaxID=46433 RepID=X6NMM1_RETFI|nr:hypothetical protein RFI_09629 [Reticulomyxa filosa]|eukprot:ETO27505.1 hypothetical protein RFI_09629 [Reticulomyxa filosa]